MKYDQLFKFNTLDVTSLSLISAAVYSQIICNHIPVIRDELVFTVVLSFYLDPALLGCLPVYADTN